MSGRDWARRAGVLAVAAALLAANLGFFLWYRSTSRERQQKLENRRGRLEKEVASSESEAATLSSQRERLSQASSAIDEFYENRVGPRREALAPMVEELHTVLARVGVNPKQISYTTDAATDSALMQMVISFSFRSDYGKFKQLLSALETDRRWLVVREVRLSRDPDMPGAVQVRMKLATYFAGDEKAQPTAPTVAAAKEPRQ